MKIKKVCVFCAASPLVGEVYKNATKELAKLLVQEKMEVVFGGGSEGLMGELADTVLSLNGKIKGIMPQFMDEVEWGHKGVTNFEYTHSMYERKEKFLKNADAIIALPGGTGTLDELIEIMTLKRLKIFDKPIIILNINEYYNPLILMLQNCVNEKFMPAKHMNLWSFVNKPSEAISILKNKNLKPITK